MADLRNEKELHRNIWDRLQAGDPLCLDKDTWVEIWDTPHERFDEEPFLIIDPFFTDYRLLMAAMIENGTGPDGLTLEKFLENDG